MILAKWIVNSHNRKNQINRNIYGHFSEHLGRCIYGGLFVGEQSDIPNENGMRTDIVEALKQIQVPVLRWPGGCFADEYHWKDGIGPKKNRKRMVNTHWGGVVEGNSFGTHEFMELCAQVGCEPYVNGNVGSGTVQEMSEWVEYMTFDGVSPMAEWRSKNGREKPWKLKYFGVGNENWGCGGNMRPEYYADLYRRFQTFVRDYGDNKIFKIGFDYDWTNTVMRIAGEYMDAITLHYYTIPNQWQDKGSATAFTKEEYYRTLHKALRMEELVSNHLQVMNQYDPNHKVGLIVDEWGTWYDVEPGTNPGFLYQQNTMRDALVASSTLDIFNAHSDRVVMANLAQTVNVLQALILTEGSKMVLTPTYHVFDLYKNHQDAALLDNWLETSEIGADDCKIPNLTGTASEKDGQLSLTITNMSASQSADVRCLIIDRVIDDVSGRMLTGEINAKNDFDNPNAIQIQSLSGIQKAPEGIRFFLPPCSVAEITIR